MGTAKYTNREGNDATEFINDGRTVLFSDRNEALTYANKIGSYIYDVFRREQWQREKWYAFGVPQ